MTRDLGHDFQIAKLANLSALALQQHWQTLDEDPPREEEMPGEAK
jgi:hypothetical protein